MASESSSRIGAHAEAGSRGMNHAVPLTWLLPGASVGGGPAVPHPVPPSHSRLLSECWPYSSNFCQ